MNGIKLLLYDVLSPSGTSDDKIQLLDEADKALEKLSEILTQLRGLL